MAAVNVLAVIIIAVLAGITCVMFVAIIAASLLTTAASHQEDRCQTLTRRPPGRLAELARVVLGVYIRRMDPEPIPDPEPVPDPETFPYPADRPTAWY